MIVIRVELWKHGDSTQVISLGTMRISNDGTGTPTRGNYKIQVTTKGDKRLWKRCGIKGFPRKSKTVWWLIQKVLDKLLGGGKLKSVRKR